ncbi:hypothetical protein [Thalassotalea sp. Y01]|uniref:hypothetical protein n=1 Tax=Thalassotalea sp. Y01 TaxID=2729613 RepID=UPI00145E934F|nr:hypothetical protein [Thalassotalea sp. Y01]NMP17713.1 hypothetical protein [Thalassotalea sp. Y01]
MNKKLDNLAEVVAKANDLFYSKHENVDTLMGIMNQTLRAQGMQADAITIDCVAVDKKIVFLLHDAKPDMVDIALGNKNGDILSSSEYVIEEVSEAVIVGIMEMNFVSASE